MLGDPNADEIAILWQTSAACKTTSPLRYMQEAKCYHIHTYQDNGLRANFVDLTSLVRPRGYPVASSEDSSYRFLLSVCKPMSIPSGDAEHPCNGSMACLVGAGEGFGGSAAPPVVLGDCSAGVLPPRLHVHEGFLAVEYGTNTTQGACGGRRNVKVHFLCPSENQVQLDYSMP